MATKIPSNVTVKICYSYGWNITYFTHILVQIEHKPQYFKAVARPVLLKPNYGNTILCFGVLVDHKNLLFTAQKQFKKHYIFKAMLSGQWIHSFVILIKDILDNNQRNIGFSA